jgi:hypothetical protein
MLVPALQKKKEAFQYDQRTDLRLSEMSFGFVSRENRKLIRTLLPEAGFPDIQ